MLVTRLTARRASLLVAGILLVTLMGQSHPAPAHAQDDTPPAQALTTDPQNPTGTVWAFLPVFGRPTPNNGGGGSGPLNMWLSAAELAGLPTSGPAWANMFEAAQNNTDNPNLSDQGERTNVYVLAKALVYARTGNASYRQQVLRALEAVIGTESGARTLAVGRNLPAYVIAADLINLSANQDLDARFRTWLRHVMTANLDGDTLRSTHELRANNWGTHAGAARAAIAIYLGDRAELERTAQVFKGFVGDRSSYAGFNFGDLWWQCDPLRPVPINPAGCVIQGHSVDGVLPDEQRRGGIFQWPPPKENYAWGGLQGALVQAQLLYRAGYNTWQWEDAALLRAVKWLHEQANFPADGDDEWQPWLINAVYNTNFPTELPAGIGKNLAWTDWTAPAQP